MNIAKELYDWIITIPDKVDKITDYSLVADTTITDLTDGGATTLHTHVVVGLPTTVGTGGDYATVSESIAAGKVNLLLISDVTEISNSIITSKTYIRASKKGYTLAMGNYRITGTANSCFLEHITITENQTSGLQVFLTGSEFKNVIGESLGTVAHIIALNGEINDVTWTVPNVGGINFTDIIVINCKFITGGTSCIPLLNGISSTYKVWGLTINGSFSYIICKNVNNIHANSSGILVIQPGIASNIFMQTGTIKLNYTGNYFIDNFICSSMDMVSGAATYASNGQVSGVFLIADTLELHFDNCLFSSTYRANGSGIITISNCKIIGAFTTISSVRNLKLSNNNFSSTLSIDGDYGNISNCTVVGTTTLLSGAEYNVITGNTFTGGLTDNSGSTTNNINNNI